MAVGPDTLPVLHPVAGFRLGVASAGIKKPGRQDLVVMELAEGSSAAAVFTRNAFCAAPVQLAKAHLAQRAPRYLLINTGNANAGTGQRGLDAAQRCCDQLATLTGIEAAQVLPFSTGVIGEPLPVEKIVNALPAAVQALGGDNWESAARGILTTDTRPKGASVQFEYGGERVTVTGIAKGSGMIKPNMATMLGYVATDAAVAPELLQRMLSQGVEASFNRITVDGDTSTNDACMLVATGCSALAPVESEDDGLYPPLVAAVNEVLLALAQAIVRDGEGATKFVAVEVAGGAETSECLRVAYAVAESPLVKTALFASDPNWGRLLAAIGRAGVDNLDVERVRISLNGVLLAENGGCADSYREADGAAAMAQEEITIAIDLGRGEARETVWTTDLSHDYVRINAEYRS